jgi:AcrR family transcriptional regulator
MEEGPARALGASTAAASRPPRQRLAPAARLPQILEAALEEFAEHGYAGASMAATAARAGIAKGLIYHYVPGKAELFRAVVRSCLLPRFAEAEALIGRFQGSRAALLEALIDQAYARIAEERRERIILKLLLTEAERFPELAEFYRTEVLGRALDLARSILRAGVEAGEFHPEAAEEGLAEVLLAPVVMAGVWQGMLGVVGGAPSLEAMRRAHAALARRGLAAALPR